MINILKKYRYLLKCIFLISISRLSKIHIFLQFLDYKYRYFFHLYNNAWENERSIEVPIVWKEVKENQNKEILEIGNVLSHYLKIHHDVIDKYEQGEEVINKDIVSYRPKKKYDLIVSISTLEHVGFDEPQKDPKKILLAINNVRKLLKLNGKAVFTIPLGYNQFFDKILKNDQVTNSEIYFLKRISKNNLWQEVAKSEAIGTKYNYPFGGANALAIVYLKS